MLVDAALYSQFAIVANAIVNRCRKQAHHVGIVEEMNLNAAESEVIREASDAEVEFRPARTEDKTALVWFLAPWKTASSLIRANLLGMWLTPFPRFQHDMYAVLIQWSSVLFSIPAILFPSLRTSQASIVFESHPSDVAVYIVRPRRKSLIPGQDSTLPMALGKRPVESHIPILGYSR